MGTIKAAELTSDQRAKILANYRAYASDFRLYARDILKVRDHNTQAVVPFVFNAGQEILHAVLEKQKAQCGYIKALLLKSRRFGGSTYTEGRFYWLSSLRTNRNTFIVGHEQDSSNTLYAMAKLFHELNPNAPSTRKSNAKELVFDTDAGDGLKSEYRVACAANLDAGRSQGIHYLHCSENAFWQDADTLLGSLYSCVPDPPAESEIIIESTANGYGNRFQRDVMATYAEGLQPYYQTGGHTFAWKSPVSDWVLIFIPWFVHERYSRAFESEKERQEFWLKINRPVTDKETMQLVKSEELRLMETYSISLEQLNWRAWAIENKCNGNTELFKQEYPATVIEAFLTQGANLYGRALCDMLEATCTEPALVGDPVDRQGKTKIRPNPHGHMKLWEKPDPKTTYVLTVDAGGGVKKSQEEANREPDPTCIDVWDHRTGRQAAQWHGHVHYGLIGEIVELIGNLYHRAPVCVELNNHGYTVVDDLTKRSYPQFEMKPGEPGWITTKKSRPQMLDSLHELSSSGALQVRCRETVQEMRTFVEINMKYQAEQGCHDERVITAAMASQMMQAMSRRLSPAEVKENRGRVAVQLGQYDPGDNMRLPPSKVRPPEISLGGWLDRNQKKEPDGYQEVYIR